MHARMLARIRKLVREGNYEMSRHALDEAMEDDLLRFDVESAVLTGRVHWVQWGDDRGPKYVIVGRAADQERVVGVVVRFKSRQSCAIITVYEIEKE